MDARLRTWMTLCPSLFFLGVVLPFLGVLYVLPFFKGFYMLVRVMDNKPPDYRVDDEEEL